VCCGVLIGRFSDADGAVRIVAPPCDVYAHGFLVIGGGPSLPTAAVDGDRGRLCVRRAMEMDAPAGRGAYGMPK